MAMPLVLDVDLACQLSLPAACVDAVLRNMLPPDQERMLSLQALRAKVPFLADADILAALQQLQQHRRLHMGSGGGGTVPLTLCAVPGDGRASGALPLAEKTPMTLRWQPSEDTLQLLAEREIPEDFWRPTLPEFCLYHKERGQSDYWEYRFFNWVQKKREWASGTQQDEEPQTHADWRPTADCLAALQASGQEGRWLQQMVEQFRNEQPLQGTSEQIQNQFETFARYQWTLRRHEAEGDALLADSPAKK